MSRAAKKSAASGARSGAALSRRRFMGLLAASSAALATGEWSMPAADAATATARPTASKRLSKAARADLEQQKQYARQALKTIREFPLPSGSEPAFVFMPLKPARTRRG
ncbi:MAG TPA: hypothetical protein VEY91_00390 [Candidatus Limnocylindria bacterium]|nr:hypothetical protein [Candidatus Limnocylindria bacterium]